MLHSFKEFICDRKFDPNARLQPFLENIQFCDSQNVQRVAHALIPFLNLYRPTAVVTNTVLSGMKIYQISVHIISEIRNKNLKNSAIGVIHLSYVVTMVAFSFFMPTAHLLLSHTCQLAFQIHQVSQHAWNRRFTEAGKECIQIVLTSTYLISLVVASPETILISLIAQASFEFYQSIDEFRNGQYIEGIANLALACIRGYQVKPFIQTCHRNWFGKRMTQEEMNRILEESESFSKGNLEEYLTKGYYSSYLKDLKINFHAENSRFENLYFENCDLDTSTARNSLFSRVIFKHSSLQDFSAIHSVFTACVFSNSNLTNTFFYDSVLSHVRFIQSDLTRVCFPESTLSQTHFMASKLVETNFFTAQVQQSKIQNCDLTDCLFIGTKEKFAITGGTPHRITRPVIALAWNFKQNGAFAGLINEALKDCEAIPLKFEYTLEKIDSRLLDREVISLIQEIKQDQTKIFSLPDEVIKRGQAYSEIGKISRRAKDLLQHAHGLIFPGGEDIEREFYDPEYAESSPDEYQRSIFEFALAREARETTTPTMGVCRGSQLINVYHGGTLKQHVDDHMGVQHELTTLETAPEFAKQIMKGIITTDRLTGFSAHHQAADKIGKGLAVVLKVDDTPEALISEDGNFIATQFHPEIYWIFKQFLNHGTEMKVSDKMKKPKLYSKLESIYSLWAQPEFMDNQNFFKYLIERAKRKEILT